MIICPNCGILNSGSSGDTCSSCHRPLTISSLINALDSNSETRNSAVDSLVKIGEPAYTAVIKATKSDNSVIRRKTCDILGLMGDKSAVMPLTKLLSDKDRYVRRRAANALIEIGDEKAVIPLKNKLLNDPERKVRSRSAEALGRIGDPRAIETLQLAIINDTNNVVREKARKSLDQLNKLNKAQQKAIDQAKTGNFNSIIKLLKDPIGDNSSRAKKELISIGKPAVEPLIHELDTSDQDVLGKVTFTLLEINDPKTAEIIIKPLITLLKDSNKDISNKARIELVKIGEPAVEPLVCELKTSDNNVHKKIVSTLLDMGSPKAVKPLIEYLISNLVDSNDKFDTNAQEHKNVNLGAIPYFNTIRNNGEDYTYAQEKLIKIGEPAVEPLLQALDASDVEVHRRVTFTLAKMGNPQAVEALTNISENNPNEEIRSIAYEALDIAINPVNGYTIDQIRQLVNGPLVKGLYCSDDLVRKRSAILFNEAIYDIEKVMNREDSDDYLFEMISYKFAEDIDFNDLLDQYFLESEPRVGKDYFNGYDLSINEFAYAFIHSFGDYRRKFAKFLDNYHDPDFEMNKRGYYDDVLKVERLENSKDIKGLLEFTSSVLRHCDDGCSCGGVAFFAVVSICEKDTSPLLEILKDLDEECTGLAALVFKELNIDFKPLKEYGKFTYPKKFDVYFDICHISELFVDTPPETIPYDPSNGMIKLKIERKEYLEKKLSSELAKEVVKQIKEEDERIDVGTRNRLLQKRLIDENDEYMDDIISGLYGNKK